MSGVKAGDTDSGATRRQIDPEFWRERRVLLTGHTGFKGAWLSLWLQSMGAQVVGFSLGEPPSEPSLYALARVGEGMAGSVLGDIRDAAAIARELAHARPEIVIHMAAQPLVRRSFAAPRDTYDTNVMGTVNLLDAVRRCEEVRAVVVVTSDKCYENRQSAGDYREGEQLGDHRADEQLGGYREGDPLGGHDPYSSSKAAAELVTSAYRRSFFSDPRGPRVATARAGNVIGGGDWGEDRLIPDLVRAAQAGQTLRLRNPSAVRPWQHVFCPLAGYLLLAQALFEPPGFESPDYACAWNFGPSHSDARTVEWVVRHVSGLWPGGVPWELDGAAHPQEAARLELDSTQARTLLGWVPPLDLEAGLRATVEWYLAWLEGHDLRELTLRQLATDCARTAGRP